MASSKRDALAALAERWTNEAFGYESALRHRPNEYSPKERGLLEMHARVKHACAAELKAELARIRRD
jgi:hypothetical protein